MTKRSVRIIIALAAVAAMVAVYFLVRGLPSQDEESPPGPVAERIRPIEVDQSEVVRVELQGRGSDLVLNRGEAGFEVEYPYDVEFRTASIGRVSAAFSRLVANRIVSEDPESPAEFGFAPPQATATYTLADGTSNTIEIGNQTPNQNGYYFRVAGDPTVYVASDFYIEPFLLRVDDLRDRSLPNIPLESITYFRLERRDAPTIEISRRIEIETEEDPFVSQFAGLVMNQPYERTRGVASDRFQELLESLPQFSVDQFVAEEPADLSTYGLNPPVAELVMANDEDSIHYLIGEAGEMGGRYIKQPDESAVYTARGDFDFLDAAAFTLVDKFALIPNIQDVSAFRIEGPDTVYLGSIEREPGAEEDDDPEATYFLDGEQIPEDPFKNFYQVLIGVLFDAELREPVEFEPEVTISYEMTDGTTRSIQLVPYDENFYAVFQDGLAEFLASRRQVQRVFDGAADLLEGDFES